MRYAVVIEQGENNYSAYVPDLPGCVSVGDTFDEVKSEIRKAITFHLDGMREDGLPIPPPRSRAEYVDIAAPEHDKSVQTSDRGTKGRSRIVIDGHGIKPSTPPPKPTFSHRTASDKSSASPPKPSRRA
jgi:predicted RNase H-like HicB family nuclease